MREDHPLKGIACMTGGMVLLVASDAFAKWLTAEYPASEIVGLRAMVITALWGVVAYRTHRLAVVSPPAHLLRALFALGSTWLFVIGLTWLPLAESTVAAFVGPIFITALAGPLLGEQVGVRRWSAVLAGFAGVVVMFRPAGEAAMNWLILLPVGAACAGALRDVITRRISVRENAISILFTTNLVTFLGSLSLLATWRVPTLTHAGVLAASALLIGCAHYLHIEAYRLAEAATISPFRYSSIVWGVLFGVVFFGQLPGPWVVAGGALVVASGLYIMHRERVRRRE